MVNGMIDKIYMDKKSKVRNETHQIFGVNVDNLSMAQALTRAARFLDSKAQFYIVTPNPEIVLFARKNPRYRAVLNKASLSIPDGTGLIWASRRLYGRNGLKERVTGIDFMQSFLRQMFYESCLNNRTYRVLLLGGRNNSAHSAALILQKKFPNLKFYALSNEKCRYFKFIINELIQPDCIFVALGAPKQEFWIAKNLARFPSVKLAMGIGGAFDMISGKTPRAPNILKASGAEWLWRLMIQPWRFRRIFNAAFIFPLLVMKSDRCRRVFEL